MDEGVTAIARLFGLSVGLPGDRAREMAAAYLAGPEGKGEIMHVEEG
jgi:hypothetical protein